MSFLNKIFGTKSAADEAAIFTDRLGKHLVRIEAAGDPYKSFVSEYFTPSIVSLLAKATAEKMALTQSDGSEHSFAISKAPVCYQVCTLDSRVAEAKSWFGKRYGGYSKILDHALGSSTFRGPGCEVLVHIVYSQKRSHAWVNMTILPFESNTFSFQPILPVDLLTEAELPN